MLTIFTIYSLHFEYVPNIYSMDIYFQHILNKVKLLNFWTRKEKKNLQTEQMTWLYSPKNPLLIVP